MKRIFLLLTIFTLSNELKAQSAENDWQKLALKEKPQTLISDNGVKKPKTYIFNEIGFIIQKKNECLCGGQENTIDYIYTPDNKLMEKTTTVLCWYVYHGYICNSIGITSYLHHSTRSAPKCLLLCRLSVLCLSIQLRIY